MSSQDTTLSWCSSYISLFLTLSSHLPLPLTSHYLILKCPRCGTVGSLPSSVYIYSLPGFIQPQGSPYHLNNDSAHISVFNLTSPPELQTCISRCLRVISHLIPNRAVTPDGFIFKIDLQPVCFSPTVFPLDHCNSLVSQFLPLHLFI